MGIHCSLESSNCVACLHPCLLQEIWECQQHFIYCSEQLRANGWLLAWLGKIPQIFTWLLRWDGFLKHLRELCGTCFNPGSCQPERKSEGKIIPSKTQIMMIMFLNPLLLICFIQKAWVSAFQSSFVIAYILKKKKKWLYKCGALSVALFSFQGENSESCISKCWLTCGPAIRVQRFFFFL